MLALLSMALLSLPGKTLTLPDHCNELFVSHNLRRRDYFCQLGCCTLFNVYMHLLSFDPVGCVGLVTLKTLQTGTFLDSSLALSGIFIKKKSFFTALHLIS